MLTTRRMATRYRNLSLLFAGLTLACFVLAFAGPWAGVLLLFVGVFLALPSWLHFQQRWISWRSGAKGEEEVVRVLESLRGCYVLHDIVLPGARGNIDHVVVAPSGVHVVETKNYTGTTRCTGGLWEVRRRKGRGRPYIKMGKDPGAQARRNAVMLRRHISANTALDPYVNAIVCFTSPQCELKVHSAAVPVVRPNELRDAILDQRSSRSLSPEEMTRIWHALSPSQRK